LSISDYQGSGLKIFAYFYELTFNDFSKKMIISIFSDYFCFFDQFYYFFMIFSCKVIFDRIKSEV